MISFNGKLSERLKNGLNRKFGGIMKRKQVLRLLNAKTKEEITDTKILKYLKFNVYGELWYSGNKSLPKEKFILKPIFD